MLDLLHKKYIFMTNLRMILDDVDEMINNGHHDNIMKILKQALPKTQIVMTASIFSSLAECLARVFINEPAVILYNRVYDLSLEGVRQYYIQCDMEKWKGDTLLDLLESLETTQVLIYVSSHERAMLVKELLSSKRFPA
jgi:superfamily II DNA/RNA helicase